MSSAVLGSLFVVGVVFSIICLPGRALAQGGGSGGFTGQFAVGPVGPGVALSYFRFNLQPGKSVTGAISVVGESKRPIAVVLFPSLGVTSPNSGDAYVGEPAEPCRAASCWLDGLARTITLAYHERETVSFTVRVPPGVAPGQYLAGVSVQPAALASASPSPSPSASPSSTGSGAESILAREVVVGVAVTVGSGYRHELVIPKVLGTRIGSDAGLVVYEADHGRAFEHPKGIVTVEGPQRESWRFAAVSGTVLPGGEAGIRVLAPRIPPGTYLASTYLKYDAGQKTARWTGEITIPVASPQPVSIGPGTRVVIVPAASPGWLWPLVGVLAGLLLIAGGSWPIVLWRRRRRSKGEPAAGV